MNNNSRWVAVTWAAFAAICAITNAIVYYSLFSAAANCELSSAAKTFAVWATEAILVLMAAGVALSTKMMHILFARLEITIANRIARRERERAAVVSGHEK